MYARLVTLALLALLARPAPAEARVIVQWFETDWREIEARLPELALIGYDALWLPPPQKGAEGVRDVGFSVYDRFDLGDQDQRGTVRTRYGTRDELLSLCDAAHAFGVRVMFDVVMNHNANPSLIENQGVDLPPVGLDGFPDLGPLDYHVLPARPIGGGAYEARAPLRPPFYGALVVVAPYTAENPEPTVAAVPMPPEVAASFPGFTHLIRTPRVIFDGDLSVFENQNYALLGLVDLALDVDGVNATLDVPLPRVSRCPGCPEEDVVEYILRWIVWLADETSADGFRLDAVRHAPTPFFDVFNQAIQDAYDARLGFTDVDDKDLLRDAQLFGESFTGDIYGELAAYHATGMQMLNFPLFFTLGGVLSSGAYGNGDLGQLSFPQGGDAGAPLHEFGGLSRTAGVSFAQSHDSPPPDGQPNLAYAFILTRPGDAVVFFDGNNPDPRSFVQPGRPDALGDLSSRTITDLVHVHTHFARGTMWNRYVDDDAYVYERAGTFGPTLLAVLHDNLGPDGRVGPDGVARFGEYDPRPLVVTAFPPGTVLVDVTGHSPLHETVVLDPATLPPAVVDRALAEHDRSSDFGPPANFGLVYLAVPSGPDRGYAMYAPRVPQGPQNGARALSILQAGQRVEDATLETVGEKRTAGGARIAPHALTVARVTGQTVTVRVRTDATAEAVYLAFDGGGAPLAGRAPVTGSQDGGVDGFVEMTAAGTAGDGELLWELGPIDASAWSEGAHVLRARATRVAESGALVWNTFAAPLVVDRVAGDGPPLAPPDVDGDGVLTADDDCPNDWDPTQTDFDEDGVGDLCDLCPLDGPAPMLDADGCRALDTPVMDELVSLADLVLGGGASLGELVRRIDEVNAP